MYTCSHVAIIVSTFCYDAISMHIALFVFFIALQAYVQKLTLPHLQSFQGQWRFTGCNNCWSLAIQFNDCSCRLLPQHQAHFKLACMWHNNTTQGACDYLALNSAEWRYMTMIAICGLCMEEEGCPCNTGFIVQSLHWSDDGSYRTQTCSLKT